MRKLLSALLCALIACAALQPAVLAASNSIDIDVNGRQLTLLFDPSEQFSNVSDGYVQASFYTYLDESNDLYELYMLFPRDVQPGTTIDPAYARQSAPEASVVMILTTQADGTRYYFAGQAESTDGTDYAMTFETVTDSAAGRTYSGTLSATMVGMSAENNAEVESLRIQSARFSFTMPDETDDPTEDAPGNLPDAADPDDPFAPYDGEDSDPFAYPSPTREVFRV